jgi:hypothetical protein
MDVGAAGEPGREMPGGQAGTTVRSQVRLPDNDGMIRDIILSAKGTADDQYYEPPARVLSLAVIGGDAHLAIYEHSNAERAAGSAVTAEVPARPLLLALTAAIEDDQRTATGDSTSGRDVVFRRELAHPRRPPCAVPLDAPPQRRSRSVRSSDTRARAGVRLVNSRGAPWRHTREGDVKDIWNRAGVEDVIHFARSLDERLPRAVRGGLALVVDR